MRERDVQRQLLAYLRARAILHERHNVGRLRALLDQVTGFLDGILEADRG